MVRSSPTQLRVLIAGASGFIGTELTRQLAEDGHSVRSLVRREPRLESEYRWSLADQSIDPAAIEWADAVINLAGATTGRIPWTRSYKEKILDSRILGTRAIVGAIANASNPPRAFLSGSAVGYFGHRPGELLTDTSERGTGFLSDVVQAWEAEAQEGRKTTRVVLMRTGLVVGRGGAFTPLIPLTRLGLGARMGSGAQYWPWVSLYDEAAAIRHLLTSSLSGAVSIVGPTPATADEVTKSLARALQRWQLLAIPEFAIRALGDAGVELLLTDQNVAPALLVADGFRFRDHTIDEATAAIVVRPAPEQ